ncbi:MAG TPA: hypothetical protein VFA41_17210 [Ktedonobacteraceae bacterium]|jgi:uncharacterized Tic20 family protein|nr:hypothetical protein [Ktedonobacteraceae bacterium]
MKVIRAIYNFIVGDMVILVGVLLTAVILGLINFTGSPLRSLTGIILVVAVLITLLVTLYGELRGRF